MENFIFCAMLEVYEILKVNNGRYIKEFKIAIAIAGWRNFLVPLGFMTKSFLSLLMALLHKVLVLRKLFLNKRNY